jgi:hypothetical protein
VGGAFLSYLAFRDGKPGFAVVYAVLTVASACLWFDIRQAKWIIIAYFAVATLGGLVLLVARGLELRLAAQLLVGLYSIYLLVRRNDMPPDDGPREVRLSRAGRRVLAYLRSPEGRAEIERLSREREKVRRWEVMIELPSGQAIAGPEIAEKASTAFGRRFAVHARPLDPVDASFLASEENGPVVDGDGPHFFCGLPPYLFEVTQVDRFLFVHYTPSATYSKELENGYRWTAKLAAEFVSVSPASVTLGKCEYRAADPAPIAEAMRSPDPEAALEPFSVEGDEPVSSE